MANPHSALPFGDPRSAAAPMPGWNAYPPINPNMAGPNPYMNFQSHGSFQSAPFAYNNSIPPLEASHMHNMAYQTPTWNPYQNNNYPPPPPLPPPPPPPPPSSQLPSLPQTAPNQVNPFGSAPSSANPRPYNNASSQNRAHPSATTSINPSAQSKTFGKKPAIDHIRDKLMDTDYEEGEVMSDADKGSLRTNSSRPNIDGIENNLTSSGAQAPRQRRKRSPPTSNRNKPALPNSWDSRRNSIRDGNNKGLPPRPDKVAHGLRMDKSHQKAYEDSANANNHHPLYAQNQSAQKQAIDSISPKTKMFDARRDSHKGEIDSARGPPQSTHRERKLAPVVQSRSPIRKPRLGDSRARAKGFLKFMHEHGYTLRDFVKEDLDIDILRDLYSELGLLDGPTNEALPKASLPPRPKSPESVVLATASLKKSLTSQEQPRKPDSEPQNLAFKAPTEKVTTKLSKVGKEDSNVDKTLDTQTQASTKAQISTSAEDVPKHKEVKRQEPILDRKDYIARLQAAKNQKSSLAPPGKLTERTENVANKTNGANSAKSISSAIAEEPPKSQSANDIAEKKRTQTELARQRMEALAAMKKKDNSVKDQPAPPVLEPIKPLAMPLPQKISGEPMNATNDPTLAHATESGSQAAKPSSASASVSDSQAVKPSAASPSIPGSQIEGVSSAPMNTEDEGQTRASVTQSTQPNFLDSSSRTNSMSGRSIPGLFMTVEGGPVTESKAKTTLQQASAEPRLKKRPVASDFDDFSFQPPTKSFKGPFGSSFNNSHHDEEMIIHASEEESSESESEGEIVTDKSQSGRLSDTTNSQINSQTPRRKDMPPLSDFPRRTLSTKRLSCYSGSGRISPSGTQSPGSILALEKTQEQISTMKKRIAELEERKKQKVIVVQAENPSETPASLEKMVEMMVKENELKPSDKSVGRQNDSLLTQPEPAKEVLAITEPEEPKTDLHNLDASPKTEKPLEPKSVEAPDLQWKDNLQKTLATSNAALASTKAQLDQLRKNVEEAESKLREQLLQKEKLAQEFEALSVISLPVSKIGDNANEKNNNASSELSPKIDDPTQPEIMTNETAKQPFVEAHSDENQKLRSPILVNHDKEQQESNEDAMQISEDDMDTDDDDQMQLSDSSSEATSAHSSLENDAISNAETQAQALIEERSSDTRKISQPASENDPGQGSLKLPVRDLVDRVESRQSNEISESPDTSDEVVEKSKDLQTVDGADNIAPFVALSSAREASTDLRPDRIKRQRIADIEAGNGKSSSAEEALVDLKEDMPDTLSANPPASHNSMADDLAPELRASREPESVNVEAKEPHLSEKDRYRPYESPLKAFKSYRYHPEFERTVRSGYRSMTYSHNIDASKPICQYEAAGGTCNDESCDSQHFRQMGLSADGESITNLLDDMILVRLGTSNPGRTKEEEQQWNEGLKLVLKNLRQKNTKDLDVVAKEIASYRRRFLKDPSKILNL